MIFLELIYIIIVILCRIISTILGELDLRGFDIKSLRAFRVIRPLRLISGVPSKFTTNSQHGLFLVVAQTFISIVFDSIGYVDLYIGTSIIYSFIAVSSTI